MEPIDIVVTWVDGADPAWLSQREPYLGERGTGDAAPNRYRDWDLMRYWFRGIEAYAPWANRIVFVTWGHVPPWLNREHPKLTIVTHEDFLPEQYLPTFNSNVIEWNLHRIPNLSEQFLLFNDDMFLLRPTRPEDFFRSGLPRDTARLGILSALSAQEVFPHTILNNGGVLNRHFSKKEVLRRHWRKFFALCYGRDLLRNLCLLPFAYISCFQDTHLPTPHVKQTFRELWEAEGELLDRCGSHRFRCREDVTHWLVKGWRFCQGEFYPKGSHWGRFAVIGADANIPQWIKTRKYQVLCLNDGDPDLDFPKEQAALRAAFEAVFPEASQFEAW